MSWTHLTASLSTNIPTPMAHLHHNNARATKSLRQLINMNIIKTLGVFQGLTAVPAQHPSTPSRKGHGRGFADTLAAGAAPCQEKAILQHT